MAVGIHVVHESLIDRYAARVAELAKGIKVGDPYLDQVALGPIVSEKQRDHVHSLVEEAIRLGADLLEEGSFQGLFYRPTVLKNVPQDARAFKEEIFGPVAVIVSFKDESEAVRLANGTGYGLTASVFGELQRARKVAEQIETGMLHINDMTLIGDVKAPFGGVKGSGNFTRIGGGASIEESTPLGDGPRNTSANVVRDPYRVGQIKSWPYTSMKFVATLRSPCFSSRKRGFARSYRDNGGGY
jgi:benzaldehyde dehydrogenase (NAD)